MHSSMASVGSGLNILEISLKSMLSMDLTYILLTFNLGSTKFDDS